MANIIVPQQPSVDRLVAEALTRPHPAAERFDDDFPVAMRCSDCGQVGYGPRSQIRLAVREHRENDCPARKRVIDEPHVTRIFYPRT